jgi:hypothetical protein
MVIWGFAELELVEFMEACADGGKRFLIPIPGEDDKCIHIKIDDRREHKIKPIAADSEKTLKEAIQNTWGWAFVGRSQSGSVVNLRFKPKSITTSEMFEDLMGAKNVLNVELTPAAWVISYIIPRSWPDSLDQIKTRHPERFKNRGAPAGKSTSSKKRKGSRFRRV